MSVQKSHSFLIWICFGLIMLGISMYFLLTEPISWGGDIAEYYGTTESLLRHGSPELRPLDRASLEKVLNPVYFEMKGYYIEGVDGNRYPVHFIFYSILATPVRIALSLFGQPELKALTFTNILLFGITSWYILKKYIKNTFQQLIFLLVVSVSPLIYFIAWPGPDVYYLCLTLISAYAVSRKEYGLAATLVAFASWHSQPLMILAMGLYTLYILSVLKIGYHGHNKKIEIHFEHFKINHLALIALGCLLVFIPYLYNLLVFGVFSPWQILKDFWTEFYGFGMQNMSLKKFIEQLIDPNIGLFWYMPVLFIIGLKLFFQKARTHYEYTLLLVIIFLTALFYQTNPAWHYGTAGYGPTRHAIFIMPYLMYFFIDFLKPKLTHVLILLLFVLTQSYVLWFNGFLRPNFLNVLNHTPYAHYILKHYPSFYNPTPEIFVDRTNNTDHDYPTSSFYTHNGLCTKAYVLKHEEDKAIAACGYVPQQYKDAFKKDANITNISKIRTLKTPRALFYPRTASCSPDYVPYYGQAYVCMKTVEDVVRYTGITDTNRIHPIDGVEGAWELSWSTPLEVEIPPGYEAEYYNFEGVYINY